MESYGFKLICIAHRFCVIFCFAVIKLHSILYELDLVIMLVPSIGSTIFLVAFFATGIRIFTSSKAKINLRVTVWTRGNNRHERKVGKSLNPLTIKFGKYNYMERVTPLVVMSSLIQHIIQLTLMKTVEVKLSYSGRYLLL